MAANNYKTNKFTSCKCSNKKSSEHSSKKCDSCLKKDDHTKK